MATPRPLPICIYLTNMCLFHYNRLTDLDSMSFAFWRDNRKNNIILKLWIKVDMILTLKLLHRPVVHVRQNVHKKRVL